MWKGSERQTGGPWTSPRAPKQLNGPLIAAMFKPASFLSRPLLWEHFSLLWTWCAPYFHQPISLFTVMFTQIINSFSQTRWWHGLFFPFQLLRILLSSWNYPTCPQKHKQAQKNKHVKTKVTKVEKGHVTLSLSEVFFYHKDPQSRKQFCVFIILVFLLYC